MEFARSDLRKRTCEAISGSENLRLKHSKMNDDEDAPMPSTCEAIRSPLSHLKNRLNVTDYVVSIPSHFNEKQKCEYLKSFRRSDLKPPRLIHECTAIALSYGYYKDIAPSKQSIVAFVFVDRFDTQISIARFQSEEMKILSHASDSSLGENSFYDVLFNHFSEQVKDEHKLEFSSKASKRLRSNIEKMSEDLMDNTEACIDFGIDGVSVKRDISREKFDHLCSDLLIRIGVLCTQAVTDAEVDLRTIDSVELIGSVSKLPSISKVLFSVFKRAPNWNVNSKDCIAKGCALQCAILDNKSNFKRYDIKDSYPFSIEILSTGEKLFERNTLFPVTKELEFPKVCISPLKISYSNFDCLFATEIFEVEHHKMRVELNINGIVNVSSATDSLMEDLNTSQILSKDQKTRDLKTNVKITENIHCAMSEADVEAATKKDNFFLENDQNIEQIKSHKNSLESYVYGIRNKLHKSYAKFAKYKEKAKITKTLKETEDWLYGEGEDESKQVYISKLEELVKMVEPIVKRYKEEEHRQQRQIELKNMVKYHKLSAQQLVERLCQIEQQLNSKEKLSFGEIEHCSQCLKGIWEYHYEDVCKGTKH